MKRDPTGKIVLGLAALAELLPIVITYATLARYARNQPMFDDYLAILGFAVQLHDRVGVVSRIAYVAAAQHSEYKLIFEHAIVALELALTGRVNLLLLCWLGNLSVLGLLAALWKGLFPRTSNTQTRLLLMVPVCWLLFQLNDAENFDWAMGGLQALTVIVFSAWSLYLLTRPGRPAFLMACLTGLLAVFSSANGLLLAPIGVVMLIRQTRWPRVAAWVATFGMGLAVYLYRYSALRHPDFHLTLLDRAVILLSLLGGAVENRQHQPFRGASIALGVALVAVSAFAARRGYGRANPFAAGFWIWIYLSAIPIVAFRADASLTAQLTGRYKIYCDLLLILAFAFAVRNLKTVAEIRAHPRAAVGCLAASVLFSCFSDVVGVRFLVKRRNETEMVAQRRAFPPEWGVALDRARAQGIYALPQAR